MIYKMIKNSEGVYIKVKCESGENIDRLELSRFTNANLKSFITNLEINGKSVIAKTTFNFTLSEYIKTELNFQRIVILLKQCIDVVDEIVNNKFLLMYVDFDLEHVRVSNFGALQFLYLPAEEERENSGYMSFFERVCNGIKASDDFGRAVLSEIIYKVERMPFFSSHQLRTIIDSAEKKYEKMLAKRQDEKARQDKGKLNEGQHAIEVGANRKINKEAPAGTSKNFSVVFPRLYNLSTGEIMTYNPGDIIVLSDRNTDDIQIS